MSFHDEVYALLKDGATPEGAVASILASASKERIVSMCRPVLLERARHIARSIVRRVEQDFDAEAMTDPEARSALAGRSFALPDGRMVRWDEATEGEHLLRAGWQRRLAGGLVADAERHEAAAEMIRAAGVRCLAELDQATEETIPNHLAPGPEVPDGPSLDAKPMLRPGRREDRKVAA